MERSWLGAESMMQKCDIEEIYVVKKSILKIAFTSWNYRKRHPIRVEGSTFSRNACAPKDRKQGFDKYKNL